MQVLLDVILPVFMIIGLGYAAVWRELFTSENIDALMKFAQSFAIPFLLFKGMAEIDLEQSFQPGLLGSFYIGSITVFLLGILGARWLFKRDWEDCITIGFCCLFCNSLVLGLAITERAYGANTLQGNFAIVTLHAPFCYGVGITAMEIALNKGKNPIKLIKNVAVAMFKNALVIAMIAGFIVNFYNISLPNTASVAIDMIVQVALPIALFGMGGVLYQYRTSGDIGPIIMISIASLLLHPIFVLFLGTQFTLDTQGIRSAVLTSAMAPGINAYIFSNIYQRGQSVAASTVLLTTIGSVFTIWAWLKILP